MGAKILQVKRKNRSKKSLELNLEDYFFLNIQDHSKIFFPQFSSN